MKKISDLALTQKVGTTHLYLRGIKIEHMSIEVNDGAVHLGGTFTAEADKQKCERIISEFEGVKMLVPKLPVVRLWTAL
jgi:osmotically-inducible protein OsmY